MTTPEGNMNPKFTEVDIEPDEDLNTKLKFFVSSPFGLIAWVTLKDCGYFSFLASFLNARFLVYEFFLGSFRLISTRFVLLMMVDP